MSRTRIWRLSGDILRHARGLFFFAFLGPNGAGKFTTISIIRALLGYDSGSVEISGRDVSDPSVRANIGVVFQDATMYDRLILRENISLRRGMYGLRCEPLRETVDTAMRISD